VARVNRQLGALNLAGDLLLGLAGGGAVAGATLMLAPDRNGIRFGIGVAF
jgi:hypothetical protein